MPQTTCPGTKGLNLSAIGTAYRASAQIRLHMFAMPAKKPPPKDEKPQKERFIEAAKKAGVDEAAFEKALKRIAPEKRPPRPPKG